MMMSQSFVRNLLVLFALCALLIQAAPVKVRRSRVSSGRDGLPRLPRRSPVIKQAFAPARLLKRQSGTTSTSATTFTIVLQTTLSSSSSKAFKSATSSSPASTATGVSVSVSTATVTQTATVTVTSSAVPGTSNAVAPTSFAITASTPPVVPVSAPPTSGNPAKKLATITGATSTSTDATGTTVTISVDSLPTPNSSIGVVSTGTQSAGSCKPTTIFNKAELHANPQVDITLWKAVPDTQDAVTALISNPIPPRNEKGDFNANGAFYVTDTWQAAAQAACYASGKQIDNVAVIQYQWTPQADTKIVEFESQNIQWQAFVDQKNDQSILSADMIAGPMTLTKDITTSFWQYALNSDAALQNLALTAVYQPIQCSNIPRGNCLPVMV